MAHKRFKFLGVAAVVLMVAMACGGSNNPGTSKQYKIGLVTDIGGLNDKSFNQAANTGRLQAEKDLGLQTQVIESKKQEDYVPNLTNYAQQSYDLVIGVGFLMTNSVWKVAKQFPNVKFAIIDGAPANDKGDTENLPNVANLLFKEQATGRVLTPTATTSSTPTSNPFSSKSRTQAPWWASSPAGWRRTERRRRTST